MPKRKPFIKGSRYHVYNRGNNKQTLCFQDCDFQRMLHSMVHRKKNYKGFRILAYSLLPNHFHLIVHISKSNLELSSFIERRCATYASFFVRKYPHEKGARVFENNFCAKRLDSFWYRKQALYFVENNPIKHKLVSSMDEWKFASNSLLKDPEAIFSFDDKEYDWDFFKEWEFEKQR